MSWNWSIIHSDYTGIFFSKTVLSDVAADPFSHKLPLICRHLFIPAELCLTVVFQANMAIIHCKHKPTDYLLVLNSPTVDLARRENDTRVKIILLLTNSQNVQLNRSDTRMI